MRYALCLLALLACHAALASPRREPNSRRNSLIGPRQLGDQRTRAAHPCTSTGVNGCAVLARGNRIVHLNRRVHAKRSTSSPATDHDVNAEFVLNKATVNVSIPRSQKDTTLGQEIVGSKDVIGPEMRRGDYRRHGAHRDRSLLRRPPSHRVHLGRGSGGYKMEIVIDAPKRNCEEGYKLVRGFCRRVD